MDIFEKNLEKYAELGIKVGANVQPGQTLFIQTPLSTAYFTRKLVKKAYEAGAKYVNVDWFDEELIRIRYDNASKESFTEYHPMWKAKGLEEMAENGDAFLFIKSNNPDLLKGVDPELIATANKASGIALKKFKEYTSADKVSWTIIAAPSKDWAAKVFPDIDGKEQERKLWDAIFKATRVDLDNPVKAWQEHDENLQKKVKYFNNKKYRKLHYKGPGTDLTIELPEKHLWNGASSINAKGINFMANMPTEEIFTMPLKNGVNGTVSSTRPLIYSGVLIDKFSLIFKDGKIIDFTAEKGYETLKRLIETDEGTHYLGEVALVPDDSPISNSNITFYNTLFDENASCHLAIGYSIPSCLEGGENMSREELEKNGANQSLIHVDFMIGSAELDIDGETYDGKLEPIFRKGNWAY